MNINDISRPIEKQNVIIFLKLTDKRKTKAENIDVNELKKKLISQKKMNYLTYTQEVTCLN